MLRAVLAAAGLATLPYTGGVDGSYAITAKHAFLVLESDPPCWSIYSRGDSWPVAEGRSKAGLAAAIRVTRHPA